MTGQSSSKWNPWPIAIIAWFIFFTSVCVIFVIRSLDMKYDLVDDNYYERGLAHGDKQVALGRTRALENPPRIELNEVKNELIIFIPEIARGAVLDMYRPSDSKLDRHYELQDGQASVIDSHDFYPGLWEASISWTSDGVTYLHREKVSIP